MTWELPAPLAERLRALRERPIDVTDKGIGLIVDGVPRPDLTAAHIAAARPSLHDAGFGYPLLTLREPALRNNLTAMASYCERTGVLLAPHGKTGMSPELAARQLTHGAWGITVATIGQLRTYREFGFPRLLLANELVDEAGIAWLAAELSSDSDFEAFCYVDSIDGVEMTRPRAAPGFQSAGHARAARPSRPAQASGAGGDRARRRPHRMPDRRAGRRGGTGGDGDRHSRRRGRSRL